jgi:hypothetical protein
MGDVAKLPCTNRRGVSAIGRPRMLSVARLAPRRIVGIAFGPTAIIRGSIVGIEARGHAQPVRQIWVGQKLAAKGDQIRFALLEPCFRGVSIKAAGYDQRSAIFLPNKRKQLLRAGVRRIAFLDRGETRIHDMKIGEAWARHRSCLLDDIEAHQRFCQGAPVFKYAAMLLLLSCPYSAVVHKDFTFSPMGKITGR